MYSNSCGIVCVAKRQNSKAAPCRKENTMNITEITTIQKPQHDKLRLAPYCRVSSNSEDQLHSYASQIRYYSNYVKQHSEYILVDIYADEGITGTEMKNRDELNRLISDCSKGKIDRIIVKSVSRIARNTEDLLVMIRMFKEMGVSVYFEEQGIDTNKLNMEMIVTFPGMAAQQESVNISGNLRWSYKKRMQSGEFNCTCPAYGFDLKDGKLIVNEDEATVVRRIFDLYLQGVGLQTIANILNNDGIPRRYGYTKWHHMSVKYTLKNERYMGDALLQKTYTTETLPFRQMRNNGQLPQYYVENSNPPIISRETFEAAQNLMKSKKVDICKLTVHPLTKKIKCAECGRNFRRLVTGNNAYWVCSGRTANISDCKNNRVRETAIYDAFNCMLIKLKMYQKELLGTMIHQLEIMQHRTSQNQERIYKIDREIADLGAKNLVITKLHTNGVLSATEYSMQTSEISGRITELRIERKKKLSEDENDELLDLLKDLNEIIKEYEPTIEFDTDLFNRIVDNVVVENNTQITFNLIGGIKLNEEIDERSRCKTV